MMSQVVATLIFITTKLPPVYVEREVTYPVKLEWCTVHTYVLPATPNEYKWTCWGPDGTEYSWWARNHRRL